MDDDEKGECFRKYKNPEDSYRDHSEFLTSRSRYADLFKLDIMDYRSWAYGLKAAGYATNPSYATILINRIELNKLYLYDQIAMGSISVKEAEQRIHDEEEELVDDELELAFSPTDRSAYELVDMTEDKRFIYENNNVRFIYAKEGETPESMAQELKIRLKKLCSYNLIKHPDEVEFHSGDVVYLEMLRNKNRKAKSYVVAEGETIRDVALRFAVKPEKILKLNKLPEGARLQKGQRLKLK